MDLFSVKMEVDSRPVAAGSTALRAFADQTVKAERTVRESVGKINAAFRSIKPSIPMPQIQAAVQAQVRGVRQVAQATMTADQRERIDIAERTRLYERMFDQIERRQRRLNPTIRPPTQPRGGGGGSGMDQRGVFDIGILRARNILIGAAIYQTLQLGRAALETSDQIKGMESRIHLATKTQAEYNDVTEALTEISKRNLIALTDSTNLYVKIIGGLKGVANASGIALAVTDSFSAALRVGGANTREASAAAIQFAQAIGSGVLRGDEFRSLAEASPVLLQNMADGLGVARGELKSLADNGLLTANMAIGALLKTAVRAQIQSVGFGNTISGAGVQIQNAFIKMIGDVEKSTGVFSGVASAGRGFAAGLSKVGPAVDAIKTAITAAAPALVGLTAGFATFFAVTNAGAAFTSVSIGVMAVVSAVLNLRTAIVAMNTAMTAGGLISLLTNPVLLGIIAAGGVVAFAAGKFGSTKAMDARPASKDAADYIADLDKQITRAKEFGKVRSQSDIDKIEHESAIRREIEAQHKAMEALGANDEQRAAIRVRLKDLETLLTAEGQRRIDIGKREAEQAKEREMAAKRLLEEEKRLLAMRELRARTIADIQNNEDQFTYLADGMKPDAARIYADFGTNMSDLADDAIRAQRAVKFMSEDTVTLGKGFDKSSSALFNFVNGLQKLVDSQDEYNAALGLAGKNEKERAAVRSKYASVQIDQYANLAGAAKEFFKEGSDGYKAMAAAEKAFRAIQFAMSVRAMVQDNAETISSVANSGAKAVASGAAGIAKAFEQFGVWGFVGAAAIVAALAAVGVRLSGGGGGGSTASQNINTGAGTVLGDPTAQSESVSKSIEVLTSIESAGLEISRSMLMQLRSIDSAIRGVGLALAQNAAIGGSATGFNFSGGFNAPGAVSNIAFIAGGGGGGKMVNDYLSGLGALPDYGAVIVNKLVAGIAGGISTTQTDTGLAFESGQKLGEVLINGINASFYATVRESKDAEFGRTVYDRYYDMFQSTSDELRNNLTSVIANLIDATESAGKLLGLSDDQLNSIIDNMSLGFDKISLQGLSAEDIQKRLSAAFSVLGDTMATAILDAFDPETLRTYQQVGEGALETLVRIASQTKAVTSALDGMGVSLGDIAMKLRIEISQSLIDLAGGIDNLGGNLTSFIDAFYTDAEKQVMQQKQLQQVFNEMNLGTLPATRAEFKALVMGLDLTTEAGRRQFTALTGLTQIADSYYTATEDAGKSTNALVDSLRALRDEAARAAAATRPAGVQLADIRSQFQTQASLAALGNTTAAGLLPELGKQFMQASLSFSTTQAEYLRDLAMIQNAAERAAQVQERGMGFTGPSMVTATGTTAVNQVPQTGQMLDISGVIGELRSLREDFNSGILTVSRNTSKLYDLHNRWDDGDRIRVHVEQDSGEAIVTEAA